MRLVHAVPMILLVLGQAQAGIIVEEAVAPPPPPAERLQGRDLTFFQKMVATGCRQKARRLDGFKEARARTGKNAASIYCACMAPEVASRVSVTTLRVMFQTRSMDTGLQESLVPQAQICLQQAGWKFPD